MEVRFNEGYLFFGKTLIGKCSARVEGSCYDVTAYKQYTGGRCCSVNRARIHKSRNKAIAEGLQRLARERSWSEKGRIENPDMWRELETAILESTVRVKAVKKNR